MKICFLSSMHPPLDKRVFEKEALTLVEAGHEVVHVCPGTPGITQEKGVKLVQYRPPKGIRARIAQFPLLYRLALEENADAYHCNEVDSWIVGAFLSRGRKICVFDVHEHYPSTFAELRFPKFMRPVVAGTIRLLYRLLTPWTACFVLAKESLSGDFRHAPGKTLVVRNFTQSPVVADPQAIRRPAGLCELVHLGAIGRARGWRQMLEAVALLNDTRVRLKLVGKFIDDSEVAFWESARALGVRDQVDMKPWLPFSEAFQILQASTAGLIAFQPGIQNHVYASPHKFFDYMAAGIPVIAPAFAVEIAAITKKHKVGLLVDSADPADIARAINRIQTEPKLAMEWGRNGIRAVQQHFNWEREANNLQALYARWSQAHAA